MEVLSRSTLSRRRSVLNHNHKLSLEREHTDYSSDSAASISSPMSSVFSTPHHSRALSASSSFESSPSMDSSEFPASKRVGPRGLPDLAEDPAELDSTHVFPPSPISPHAAQFPRSSHDASRSSSRAQPRYSRRYEDYHESDEDSPYGKRRRSIEHQRTSFTEGVRTRLGSFTKRSRHLKRASSTSAYHPTTTFPPSPSPSPVQQSRASSRNRTRPSYDAPQPESFNEPAGLETIFSSENLDQRMTYLGYLQPLNSEFEPTEYELEPRSATPLLPRFFEESETTHQVQSPLYSPTVVPESVNNVPAAIGSLAHAPEYKSPLSSKTPSMASLHRNRTSHDMPISDIPPLLISDPSDEWAGKLGHSNFTILPEPYIPQVCDAQTCQQLINDWEVARSKYATHRWVTENTYGSSSKVYKLTERKWATIDARWKRFSERAARFAVVSGTLELPSSPAEPAPVANIPQLDDPRIVQSEEIVGPMKVEPARVSPPPQATPTVFRRTSSKRESLLRIFTSTRPSRSFSASRLY